MFEVSNIVIYRIHILILKGNKVGKRKVVILLAWDFKSKFNSNYQLLRPEFFLWVDVLDNWPLDIGRGDVLPLKILLWEPF